MEDIIPDMEKVKQFAVKLHEKDGSGLREIIIRYISYLPEMAEAALTVSVDKGLISYDLKEKLSAQIMHNFRAHSIGAKETSWKSNKAFQAYVSLFSDDEIYDLIDNPSGVVIDAYYAVLSVALERELISEENFIDCVNSAEESMKSDKEEWIGRFGEYFGDITKPKAEITDSEIKVEKLKFWKCPKCNMMVDMNMALCWNCQTKMPEDAGHQGKEEILNELAARNPFNFLKAGRIIIASGIIMIALGIAEMYIYTYMYFYHWGAIAAGAIFVVLGLIFIVHSFSKKD